MRFARMTVITIVSVVVMMGVMSIAAPTAGAHTVTRKDCVRSAWSQYPNNAYRRAVVFRNCMNWRARHNICHGVYRCNAWLLIAICESGNQNYSLTASNIASIRWEYNGGSGFDGGVQFSPSSWTRLRTHWGFRPIAPYAYAHQAPANKQLRAANRWRQLIGGNPHSSAGWPNCGRFW